MIKIFAFFILVKVLAVLIVLRVCEALPVRAAEVLVEDVGAGLHQHGLHVHDGLPVAALPAQLLGHKLHLRRTHLAITIFIRIVVVCFNQNIYDGDALNIRARTLSSLLHMSPPAPGKVWDLKIFRLAI